MKTPIIEVKNLVVSYGNTRIIDGVSFTIHEGELTAILGPNGSGKSTLLKAVMGLIPVASGTVRVLGRDVHEVLPSIGYLPQRFSFDRTFPMTVREFLELSRSAKTPNSAIDDALGEVGMKTFADRLLGELSGGQLQRILIARAILNNPKILILDEPEAGIDVEAERNFYAMIQHLDEAHGITVIFISHEVDLVYDFAEQVICLNKALVCQGVPRKVLTPEMLEKLYGGGLMHHEHHHDEPHGDQTHDLEDHEAGHHRKHKN